MNARTCKYKDKYQYKQVDIVIKKQIRKAKQQWQEDKCTEIEELATKYDSFTMHKRVKELRDQQGNIVVDIKEKLKIWQQYVEDLFEDEKHTPCFDNLQEETGPRITEEEVIHVIKSSKNQRSPGPDEIHPLVNLFNKIYESSIIAKLSLIEYTKDWRKRSQQHNLGFEVGAREALFAFNILI
ncbi:hypothetical protein HUJ05_012166 [Dendroctonus ponderosae]|nr:hypothetical protein HUJ05_012166 [Dendroctonus ponderosae]